MSQYYLNVTSGSCVLLWSVVAVAFTHYKPENHRSKSLVIALAVLLGRGALIANTWSNRLAMIEKVNEKRDRQLTRDGLAEVLSRGQDLLDVISMPDIPVPEEDALVWSKQTEAFLRMHLGESYTKAL